VRAAVQRKDRRKNLAGEELVIFANPNNPYRMVSTRAEAARLQRVWQKAGYRVQITAVRGGSFEVIAAAKKNPDGDEVTETDQAVRLFQKFHGKQPAEILDEQRSAAMRLDYTALGDLRAIGLGECELHGNQLVSGWEKCNHIDFAGEEVKLASSPNGHQLYLIGGKQDLDLENFDGIDTQKDLIDLGEASFVVYDARKVHSNFEPMEWVHELGETGGERPRVIYDQIKQEIFFAGGDYFIDLGPKVSPGIEG
jgi:hypothetical protein